MHSPSKSIDILLHGDGEKGEDEFGPIKLEESDCIKFKPSPTPTREEWEKWADNVSKIIWWSKADGPTVKKALLSMPIVPKE